MSTVLFIVLLVAALAAAEAAWLGVRYLGERPAEELKRRLRTVGTQAADTRILRNRRLAGSAWLTDLLAGIGPVEKLEDLLEQTDMEMTVARLLFLMFGATILAIGAPLALGHPYLPIVLAPLAFVFPLLLVFRARKKRAKKLSEQLGETLEMMARAIKAGHALPASFKLVAQECPPPVAVEFAKAYEQQNLGLSLEATLQKMTERVPSSLDLRLLAVSVKIQKETGGNLVEMLENIAETMRQRFKFYSKLRALTAEGRMSAYILGSLPLGVALLISLTNPSYLGELTHGFGLKILIGGIVLWGLGILWIKSLLKVSY